MRNSEVSDHIVTHWWACHDCNLLGLLAAM